MNVAQRGSKGLRISGVQVPLHGSDRASELCGDLAHSQVGVSMPPIPLPREGDLWNVNPSPCRSRAPTTRPAHSPAWPACSTTSIPPQEVVDHSDTRVPQTIAAKKKQRDWMLIGS